MLKRVQNSEPLYEEVPKELYDNVRASYNNKDNKNDLETLSKVASILQRIASQEQELITKFTTARLTATKFLVSQARKVWASAAAYSSTEHKNEGYEFYNAFGEAYAYDFMSDMEALD